MSRDIKIAYSISQRNGKSFWTRIGVAFVNRDGSINVKLECLPTNGEIQLRDQPARDQGQADQSSSWGDDDIPI